jgi:hypothetical protein
MVQEQEASGILAIDIERFSRPEWTDPIRLELRARLHSLVDRALAQARIAPAQISRTDTGDGIWLVVAAQVPSIRLLDPLATSLAAMLARDNQQAPADQRLRLRLVAHAGQVLADPYGHAGQALNLTARLLGADVGRAILAAVPGAELVLLLSEQFHQRVGSLGDPGDYQPVWVSVKETSTRAWVHLPGLPRQPALSWLRSRGVAGATEASDGGWQTLDQSPVEGDDVRRRELLIYAGTLFGNLTLDRLVAERSITAGDALVAERVTWRLRGLGETMLPEQVAGALSRHSDAVARLAKQVTQATVRTDLLRVLAQTEGYAGYVAAFDLGDRRRAARRFRSAMLAADQSGDPVLAGVVCMRMADSALALGQPRQALEVATAGATLVQADPSLRVALSTTVAQAHADLGQESPARATLDQASRLMEHSAVGTSRWSRMNRPRFVGDQGLVSVRLGRVEEAAALLQQAIDWHPPGNAHRAVLSIGLATVRFEQDAPEHAATLAADALTVISQLPSAARRAMFSSLAPYFHRYRQVSAVAELAGSVRAARAASAP